MEDHAKLLADLTAAVSSMNAKVDDMHRAVLDLHIWKPVIERSVESPRAEVGDLPPLLPHLEVLSFSGPTSTLDSSATSGESPVIPDASLGVAIGVTGMATSAQTRCSTEGLTRDATESRFALSPAVAPASFSTTADMTSVHAATAANNGTLDGQAIIDATSLPATCLSECPSNDASVSAMGDALILSATMTWSMALEAVPPTPPRSLEEDHRPPWPPPKLAVVYQPDCNPCVEKVLCPWNPGELFNIQRELEMMQPMRKPMVLESSAVPSAVEIVMLCKDAEEDLKYVLSDKFLQYDKVWWQPWLPTLCVCVMSKGHMFRPRPLPLVKCILVGLLSSMSHMVQFGLGTSARINSCAHSPDNKYVVRVTRLAQPAGGTLCKWISTGFQLCNLNCCLLWTFEQEKLLFYSADGQPKTPWLSILTQIYTSVKEGGLHPHDKVMTLNLETTLAATESYECRLLGGCLLRNFYQEEQYFSGNMPLSESRLMDDTCGILTDHHRRLGFGILHGKGHASYLCSTCALNPRMQISFDAWCTCVFPMCTDMRRDKPKGNGELAQWLTSNLYIECGSDISSIKSLQEVNTWMPVDLDSEANQHWKIPWDPGSDQLRWLSLQWAGNDLEFSSGYGQEHSQGGRNVTNQATFSDHIQVGHNYYIVFVNKIFIGYDYYPDQVYCFDTIRIDLVYYRDGLDKINEVHAPWDPGKPSL